MASKRKYPVGIQSFESIRRDGYIYIDKTPLIYNMITEGKPYFLSRPRRFGKSLLCSTLEAVFAGRKELFEAFTTEDGIEQQGLFIAELKVDDTAENALKQIDQRGYADKYRLDGRPITKVGISFSSTERNITDYQCKG